MIVTREWYTGEYGGGMPTRTSRESFLIINCDGTCELMLRRKMTTKRGRR